jgi:hypothetical protein
MRIPADCDGHPAYRVASADDLAEEVRRGRAAAQAAIDAAAAVAQAISSRRESALSGAPKEVGPKPGVCFGCGCTDEESCSEGDQHRGEGCEWIDSDHTMCSACDGRARRFLAWYRLMERRVRSAAAPKTGVR